MGIKDNLTNIFNPKPKSVVTTERIREAIQTLHEYRDGIANLHQKIIDNEQWYKLRHWDLIRKKEASENEPEPIAGYLFSTIANKHADAMDNYPESSLLPREPGDQGEAQSLSTIIPLIMEKAEYEDTYSASWWYKLKQGFSIQGTFWNAELENSLGEIDIRHIDALDVYWQPGIKDIQDSRNVFITTLVDSDLLVNQYPWLKGRIEGNKVIDAKQYVYDDNLDITKKSLVIDWYYRQKIDGKTVLHLTKFVDEHVLESTEDDTDNGLASKGLYDHGLYPLDFDVLFPEEGTCTGFGFIDIAKNPQMYIDKLSQIIAKNALMAGTIRYFKKNNGGININEFLDWSKPIVEVEGDIDEAHLRQITVDPLDAFIVNYRTQIIEELKENTGNRDFSQGGTTGGVTAGSAIGLLQEAGHKLSRDMLRTSYRTHRRITYKCIELVRQFYDKERMFRIEGEAGQYNFVSYSNAKLKEQQLAPTYEGEEPKYRKPVFDIKVKPEKANPFSRIVQNEFAKELYALGIFNPEQAAQALIALEMMTFEGKDKIVKMISDNGNMYNQMMQMKQTMDKMAQVIQTTTGRDMGAGNINQNQMQRGAM